MDKTKEELLQELKAEFSDEIVKERPGGNKKLPNGKWVKQVYKYIPEGHVRERLDQVFPLSWSWHVLSKEINVVPRKVKFKDGETWKEEVNDVVEVSVLGRLTLHLPDATTVYRDAWGGSTLDKGNQAGDGYKIADSNALKKASYKFGIGSYLGLEDPDEESAPSGSDKSYKKQSASSNDNPFLS